jgi:hypothetical protein
MFSIRPGAPGDPLSIDAEFDINSYELSERSLDDGGGWLYEVKFRRTSESGVMTLLKELLGGSRPRVEVRLPPDVFLDLDVNILQGGAEVQLGGLWLHDAELSFTQGGGEVAISQPLRLPMEHLRISFLQGGGEVSGVANAGPRVLEVDFSMGGGDLDLRGTWPRDADITIDQRMGGVSVRLPENVAILGLGRYDTAPRPDDATSPPLLRFSTSSNMGELEIVSPGGP